MALQLLSSLVGNVPTVLDTDLNDQINRTARLLSQMRVETQGGPAVSFTAKFAGQDANPFTEGSDVQSSELLQNASVLATLPWAMYRSADGASQVLINAYDSSDVSSDIMPAKQRDMAAALLSKINKELFVGTGSLNPNRIRGLKSALTSNNYAGLSTGTYPQWAANVVNAGGALTMNQMVNMERTIYEASGKTPDWIVMGPAVFETYKSLFETSRRTETGHLPFGYNGSVDEFHVTFEGIPVIREKDDGYAVAGANDIYFGNNSACKLVVQREAPATPGVPTAIVMIGAPGHQIPVRFEKLAHTGDGVRWEASTRLQLVIEQPNAMGVITNVTV